MHCAMNANETSPKANARLCFYFFVPLLNGQMLAMGINDLFAGVLITFIGWLIDEARKIREEQELTV
jgi:hypothetical protein